MGGGDLNLKKSWHTQTLKNIEAVWQAEQKVENERKRMEQLQKELKEERARMEYIKMQEDAGLIKKRGDRLDWMYSGSQSAALIDEEKESFLLGLKRVDQIIKEESNPLLKKETGPETTVAFTGITAENAHRDMMAKVREDPMFAIKMREKQAIENVLKNPLKMKEFKQSSDKDAPADKRKRQRSRSRERKPRHDSRRRSPSPPHSTSLHRHESRRRSPSPHHYRRDDYQQRSSRDYAVGRHYRDRSESQERRRRRSRSPRYHRRERSRSRNERRHDTNNYHKTSESSKGVDEMEERRRKLEAMQQNAKELNSERQERVKRFAEEEDKERKEWEKSHAEKSNNYRQGDVSRMMYGISSNSSRTAGSSMSQGELHDRLRRKMNSIQRE